MTAKGQTLDSQRQLSNCKPLLYIYIKENGQMTKSFFDNYSKHITSYIVASMKVFTYI